ncbi:MAG: Cys-tRNA(Pro) deacylase [Bacteroidales bacterium]
MKITKTNAARLLDKSKVDYELVAYEVDENNLAATHVAEQLNQDIKQVFKTLVLRGDKTGIFICIIPGDAEVDLKKAAKVSGNKSAQMILMKDLLALTGYIRGGCSPIGMKKNFPGYIQNTCTDYPFIYISAGIRGLQLKINPAELCRFARLELSDVIVND